MISVATAPAMTRAIASAWAHSRPRSRNSLRSRAAITSPDELGRGAARLVAGDAARYHEPAELASGTLRGVFAEHRFDWQGDAPPRHPWRDTVIYEMHVRGFTFHPSSGVTHPGQYLGVVDKIPYLRQLGVTAVELMPVQEFSDWELRAGTGKLVRNYWGYNPAALFAPKSAYASGRTPDAVWRSSRPWSARCTRRA
jgi:isoamylase